jgi:arginyl-tRNA synthetase
MRECRQTPFQPRALERQTKDGTDNRQEWVRKNVATLAKTPQCQPTAKMRTMQSNLKNELLPKLTELLALTLADLSPGAKLPDGFVLSLEQPKQASHGDLACNAALQVAKPLGKNPREIATRFQAAIASDAVCQRYVGKTEIAGPGFINLTLTASARQAVVTEVLEAGPRFGSNREGEGKKVLLEFVSANPTGPLHVGHARQAALGDALAELFLANGWQVQREFYYNDAGQQIENLALSVQARAKGLTTEDPSFPADGYRGEYISDIANDYLAKKTVTGAKIAPVTAGGDPNNLDNIRRFAVAYLRHEQDMDLNAFGLAFDVYYLESSLYTEGRVEQTVKALQAAGHTYEKDGALWFASTSFGDDKDRVMRKSEGGYTYFVPDIAYHVSKWQRGFTRVTNVQGSDHHGTIARVRAGLQALQMGIPEGYPSYVLHKMVKVMKAGEEVKMSKRSGNTVSLRDLIEWSGSGETAEEKLLRGRDAVRFFLSSRKADTEYSFDVDLAQSRSDDNPVYYVQYAHARICSVLAQAGLTLQSAREQAMTSSLVALDAAREIALMNRLAQFPDLIEDACRDLTPHSIAFYLKDLAADLHSYYNAERFLVDDPILRAARLALLTATQQVLQNGLALLGVSAPEKM